MGQVPGRRGRVALGVRRVGIAAVEAEQLLVGPLAPEQHLAPANVPGGEGEKGRGGGRGRLAIGADDGGWLAEAGGGRGARKHPVRSMASSME